jgi:transcriptional regulator with XRE-family HTH domain
MVSLNIRNERIKRGWKLQYVADQVGVTKATIHGIEIGRRKPSYDTFSKLMDLFDYDGKSDPRWLFEEYSGASNLDNRLSQNEQD